MEDAEERSDSAAGAEAAVYTCPHCSDVNEFHHVPENGRLECPACGAQFFVSADLAESVGEADDSEETGVPNTAEDRSDELDGLRIRQMSAIRRAVSRQRSYAIVGWAVCLVAVIKLVELTIRHVRIAGWEREPIGYLMFAAAGLWGCAYFLGRARAYGRELTELSRSAVTEPQAPPDFSTLSDGSQRVRNLEEM